MGCDIHLYVERKLGSGNWACVRDMSCGVNVKSFARRQTIKDPFALEEGFGYYRSWLLRQRNYHMFALLAGVRGEGPEPRGLPEDVSELVEEQAQRWGNDGYSHSWATAQEFMSAWLDAGGGFAGENEEAVSPYHQTALADGMKMAVLSFLWDMCSIDTDMDNVNPEDYRFVFWFDN